MPGFSEKMQSKEEINLEFTTNYSTIFFFDSTNSFGSLSNQPTIVL
jgi:hypothetical protein